MSLTNFSFDALFSKWKLIQFKKNTFLNFKQLLSWQLGIVKSFKIFAQVTFVKTLENEVSINYFSIYSST